MSLSGRDGLVAALNNVSEVTGRGETVTVFTTLLRDGNLFYCNAVAPQDEYQAYERVPARGAIDPPHRLVLSAAGNRFSWASGSAARNTKVLVCRARTTKRSGAEPRYENG